MNKTESDFLLSWRIEAPAYPLVYDSVSLGLPFVGSGRKFKADFVHIETKVAIEIQGGNWARGKHARPLGLRTDYLKQAIALANGWALFQTSPDQQPIIIPFIIQTIQNRNGTPVPLSYPSKKLTISLGLSSVEASHNPF